MVTKLKILICILLSLLTFAETVYGQEDCHCPAVVYLQHGMEGKIPCQCDDFSLVSWYNSEEDYDNGESPFIKYENSETTGTGKTSGEYDVGVNGSLIITNVSIMKHGRTYFYIFLREIVSQIEKNRVKVEVLVIPDPPYPVVEGHIHQQHVYMDVSRDGELTCSMRGVHPNVSLTWTVLDPSQSNKILFQQDVMGSHKTQNEDGTYDIILSSMFQVTDPSIWRITIQCGVANEIGGYFSEKTKVDLLFSAALSPFPDPVISGCYHQEHNCVQEVGRTGELVCTVKNSHHLVDVKWTTLGGDKYLVLGEDRIRSQNNTNLFDMSVTTPYTVIDETVTSMTVQCDAYKSYSDQVLATVQTTLVIQTQTPLVIQTAYPVVNGHENQNHVYLDVDREGHLTCLKENVDVDTRLDWVLDPNMRDKVTYESNTIISVNNDGTMNINQTFAYEVHDHTLERITIECKVIEPDTDEHPLTTTVELLFSSADDFTNRQSLFGTLVGILILFLVIILVMFVIIQLYFTRKMYEKVEAKYICLPDCKSKDNINHIPEDTTDLKKQYSHGGNPDSNSREKSGSEVSEKSGQMQDIDMSNCDDKQVSMDDKRRRDLTV